MRFNNTTICVIATSLVMLPALWGYAGTGTEEGMKTSKASIQSDMLLNASTVIGTNVVDKKGKEIGSVQELMIDHDSGQIAYAVISHGGNLGFGGSVYAVPWQDLKLSRTDKSITLETDIESYAPKREKQSDKGEKGKGSGMEMGQPGSKQSKGKGDSGSKSGMSR